MECGDRSGRPGQKFPMYAGAAAAGGGYFSGFTAGGKWALGGAETGAGRSAFDLGRAGRDFVHEGGIGAVFVFPVLTSRINHNRKGGAFEIEQPKVGPKGELSGSERVKEHRER